MAISCQNRQLSILNKMKQKFSTHWKASKQPRKQRKYAAKAPIHIKQRLLSANLSKELRKQHKMRNIILRKGDKVKIMRGKFKKKQGKIIEVNVKSSKIKVEDVMIKKSDGSKVNVKIRPSNVQIIELNLDDKKRMKNIKTESKKEIKEENKK